jgi:hypothetical protein
MTQFTNREQLYLNSINNYFGKNIDHTTQMVRIIGKKTDISLRIIDIFVTKYAKKHKIIYEIQTKHGDYETFNVYLNYKAQLKSYKKKYFDPFKRCTKFNYCYNGTHYIHTTIGQLIFLKWVLEYNILHYIEDNIYDILQFITNHNKNNICDNLDYNGSSDNNISNEQSEDNTITFKNVTYNGSTLKKKINMLTISDNTISFN